MNSNPFGLKIDFFIFDPEAGRRGDRDVGRYREV
jgi:hypothetical protein